MNEIDKLEAVENSNENQNKAETANFSERFLAYFIDAVPFAIAAQVSIYYLTAYKQFVFTPATQIKVTAVWIIVYILYVSLFTAAGATIGKLIVGIRVVNLKGGRVSFWQAMLRTIGYFVSAAPLYLGYILALVNNQRRALHDYMASSMVIKVRRRSGFTQGIIISLSMGLMLFLAGSWGYVVFYRFSPNNLKLIAVANEHMRYLSNLQEKHKADYGFYTDNLNHLAEISRDADLFKKRLLYAFESEGFIIGADENRYYISAYAKDKAKTLVKVSGPK